MTGSLGILAEAAHSGLDLIAAIVTFFAVKLSSKPADKEHPYGHGKIENFSALIETVLLFITCVWISFEAIERLFFTEVKVDASIWAFAVVLLSIGVDMHRSRRLLAAAKHYHSQALEADGLHFKTDIWSSCVVFAGLIFVTIAHTFPVLHFLEKADAVAALGVAFIVIFVSSKMGNRTIQNLLDRAPDGMTEEIKKLVESIPGILDCHHIRIRCSGPDIFIELHVLMDGEKPMKETHALTEVVEKRISEVYPNADTTVHAEPK
jgi:cation diffusion facilitator family transporter